MDHDQTKVRPDAPPSPSLARADRQGLIWHMRPTRTHRLLLGGTLDLALLAILAVFTVLMGLNFSDPLSLVVDLAACLAAALTLRWPRAAGAALGLILLIYVVVPYDFNEMGDYAALIVVLGTGIRSQRRTRAMLTAGYLTILAIRQFQLYETGTQPILSSLAWAALFAVMWLIGSAIAAFDKAQEQARLAALAQQRLALARELHDTVARSLARVSRQIHQAAASGDPTQLRSVADQVSETAGQLRWMLGALRDSDSEAELLTGAQSSLAGTVRDSVAHLQSHGFQVSTSIDGSLDDVPPEPGRVLGEIVQEATANVERHGATDRPCVLTVCIDDTAVDLAFINEVRESGSPDGSARPLGLIGAAERLALVGGQLEARQEGTHWITRVMIPIAGRT